MYRPREIAQKLGIAPATLRLWSTRFAPELSDQARKRADDGSSLAQRRYVEGDLQILYVIKESLEEGLTYDEVERRLRGRFSPPPANPPSPAPGPPPPPDPNPELRGDPIHWPTAVARDVEIARLQEALAARERTIEALRELLEARERTIATLRDSIDFLNVYLHAVRGERDEVRDRASKAAELLARWEQPEAETVDGGERGAGSWWRRLLGFD